MLTRLSSLGPGGGEGSSRNARGWPSQTGRRRRQAATAPPAQPLCLRTTTHPRSCRGHHSLNLSYPRNKSPAKIEIGSGQGGSGLHAHAGGRQVSGRRRTAGRPTAVFAGESGRSPESPRRDTGTRCRASVAAMDAKGRAFLRVLRCTAANLGLGLVVGDRGIGRGREDGGLGGGRRCEEWPESEAAERGSGGRAWEGR